MKKRIVLGVAVAAIGVTTAAIAIVFLSLGFFFYLLTVLSAPWAAIFTAIAVAFFGATACAILLSTAKPSASPRTAPSRDAPSSGAPFDLGSVLGAQAREFASRHGPTTVLGSLALGFTIGASPGLRDFLFRAMRK